MDTQAYPLSMHDFGLHDPFIYTDHAAGKYYLYNGSHCLNTDYQNMGKDDSALYMDKSRGVYCYESPDLIHWSEPHLVLDLLNRPEDAWYSDEVGPWAPEVHEYQGSLYLFVTLHNPQQANGMPWRGPQWWLNNAEGCTRRGVVVARSESPLGPFVPVHPDRPTPQPSRMTLDGTLYVDHDGQPWMVYAHEWVQMFDGTMEAIRLDTDDIAHAQDDENAVLLWEASQGAWHKADGDAPEQGCQGNYEGITANGFVTDGPFLIDTPNGSILSLWTSYSLGTYVEAQAISRSGKVEGPWEQLPILTANDCGHAMAFVDLEGKLHLLMHTNMTKADATGRPLLSHGVIYDLEATDDGFVLGAHRSDLDSLDEPENDVLE